MMDARKFLINLLYRAATQSSEVPGWSHRQSKKPPGGGLVGDDRRVGLERGEGQGALPNDRSAVLKLRGLRKTHRLEEVT